MTVALIIPWRPVDPFRQLTLDFVQAHVERTLGPDEVVLADDDGLTFNRGRALAAGVAQTSSDVLVFADADLLVPGDALQRAVELAADSSYVVPFDRLVGLDYETTVEIIGRRCEWSIDWRTSEPDHVELDWPRLSTGGCNVVTREAYERGGGFDPRFPGWGFEDAAFDLAMQTLVGPATWLDAQAVHLWHPHDVTRSDDDLVAAGKLLVARYEGAFGDVDAVRALIGER